MNKKQEITNHIVKAQDLGLEEVERIARGILRKYDYIEEFVMAMGSWCFWTKTGQQIDDYNNSEYLEPLKDFLGDFDDFLGLTGCPMRFTANGPKVTDW